MSAPVLVWTLDVFVRVMTLREARERGRCTPWDKWVRGFVRRDEARAAFDREVEAARRYADPESPLQHVRLRRHRLDAGKPVAVLAAALLSGPADLDRPTWATETVTEMSYDEHAESRRRRRE